MTSGCALYFIEHIAFEVFFKDIHLTPTMFMYNPTSQYQWSVVCIWVPDGALYPQVI